MTFWRMLVMVAADSRPARMMPPRSPPMRRMPGLSMVTSVPPAHGHTEIGGGQRRHSFGASMPPSQYAAVANQDLAARDGPVTPLPASAPSTSPRLSAARTLAAPSGCSLWHCRLDGDDAGLAFGQRAGFVDRKACGPLQPLAGFGILDQHARLRAEFDRHHDGHWRCQAERAGRQVGRRCCAILSPVALEHAIVSGNATEQRRKIAVLSCVR